MRNSKRVLIGGLGGVALTLFEGLGGATADWWSRITLAFAAGFLLRVLLSFGFSGYFVLNYREVGSLSKIFMLGVAFNALLNSVTVQTVQRHSDTVPPGVLARLGFSSPGQALARSTEAKSGREGELSAAQEFLRGIAPKSSAIQIGGVGFTAVFGCVMGLTILSLLVCVFLVTRPHQSNDVQRLIETCSTTWKLGFGAVVGLIGGKSLP